MTRAQTDENEAFEAEYRRQYDMVRAPVSSAAVVDFLLRKDERGDKYRNTHVQSKWEGWQARAAIALPADDEDAAVERVARVLAQRFHMSNQPWQMVDVARAAIRAARGE